MKSNTVIRLSRRAISSLSLLKTAAIAILLSGFAIYPGAAQTTSGKSNAHVYLVRGVLNIFSLGMDEIAVKLQRQGITASVHNYLLWASIADDAAAKYKSGVKNIIFVGHSSGATALPNIVTRLDQQGVPVKLVVGLDSMFRRVLPAAWAATSIFMSQAAPVHAWKEPRASMESLKMLMLRILLASHTLQSTRSTHTAKSNRCYQRGRGACR